MIDFRFPNINGKTEAEQLSQIKSYLHQLVQQLNWAMSVLEAGNGSASGKDSENNTLSQERM